MTDANWKTKAVKSLEPIFRELFLDDGIKVTETTSPEDIDEWDSMAHVTLLASVERACGVRFTAEDMGRIGDVSTLLEVLREHGAK